MTVCSYHGRHGVCGSRVCISLGKKSQLSYFRESTKSYGSSVALNWLENRQGESNEAKSLQKLIAKVSLT